MFWFAILFLMSENNMLSSQAIYTWRWRRFRDVTDLVLPQWSQRVNASCISLLLWKGRSIKDQPFHATMLERLQWRMMDLSTENGQVGSPLSVDGPMLVRQVVS